MPPRVRTQRTPKRRPRSSPWSGTVRLGLVFAALIGVNAYFLFFRRGTSLGDLKKQAENPAIVVGKAGGRGAEGEGAPATPTPVVATPTRAAKERARPAEPEIEIPDEGRVVGGTIGGSETLAQALRREGVPPPTANEVVAALARVFDPKMAHAGHSYTLRFDAEDHLRSLEYRNSPAMLFRVEHLPPTRRGARPGWRATRQIAPVEVRVAEIGGLLDGGSGSLYDAVKRAGESPTLAGFFADIFAWDLDLYLDVQKGDRFKIVVEKQYLGDTFYKYGRVLAAEYSGKAGTFRAIWFDPGGTRPPGYYNERGESIVRSLLKSPLKYVRVSPSFDRRRFHPTLHTERSHLGVDYGAPTGTPIWAIAPGKVSWKGNRGPEGDCVVVQHPGGMETVYTHLSQFARGLEVGEVVRQKQVIGYVGQSGGAPTPHLHFSVRMGGHYVDPLRLRPAREAPLPAGLREAFFAAAAPRLEALARVEIHPARRERASATSSLQ